MYMKLTCMAQYRVRNAEHRENELIVLHVLIRDEERWEKEASKVKQTTKQSNTANPRHVYIYMLER